MQFTLIANGPGDRVSIPGRVIPKTQNSIWYPLVQYYKVRIKGKVEQSRKRGRDLSYWKGSLRVALFTYLYLYLCNIILIIRVCFVFYLYSTFKKKTYILYCLFIKLKKKRLKKLFAVKSLKQNNEYNIIYDYNLL